MTGKQIILPCIKCKHYWNIGERYCKYYDIPLVNFDSKGFLNHPHKDETLFQCKAFEMVN